MALSGKKIIATGGEIYAHVFENRALGLERGMFWNLRLECAPIRHEGEAMPTSLACEWLRWPVGDWTGLDGAALATATDASQVEATFYFAEHHLVALESLHLARVAGTSRFRAQVSGALDLEGFGKLDGTGIPVRVEAEVEFTGVIVVPGNFSPKPDTPEKALATVQPFLAVDNFCPPEWDRFRYVLAPRLDG